MPKVVNHKQKKIEIVEEAMKIFAQKGFSNTRLSDIARGCGIGRTSIYRYFSNKEDIFIYVIESIFRSLQEELKKVMERDQGETTEKIKEIMEKIALGFNRERNLMIIFVEMRILLQRGNTVLWKKLQVYQDFLTRGFEDLLEQGMERGELKIIEKKSMARSLTLIVDSLVLHAAFSRKNSIGPHIENLGNLIDGLKK